MEKFIKVILEYISTIIIVVFVGICFWILDSKQSVSNKTFIACVLPFAVFTAISLRELYKTHIGDKQEIKFPKLKALVRGRYIFEPSEIFPSQCLASIFYKDDVEETIGFGKVETVISDSNNLQVIIYHRVDGYDDDMLSRNKDKILLKPTVDYDLLLGTLGKIQNRVTEGVDNE